MIVTDNDDWADRARYLTTQAKDDPLEYVHGEIGYNYRLTNVQAAMGVAQMEQLDDYVAAKRRDRRALYERPSRDVPGITLPAEAPWADSTFWMYTVLVDETVCGRAAAPSCGTWSRRHPDAAAVAAAAPQSGPRRREGPGRGRSPTV